MTTSIHEPRDHFIWIQSMATELQGLLETPSTSSPPSPPHCHRQPQGLWDRSHHDPVHLRYSSLPVMCPLELCSPPNLTPSPTPPAFQILALCSPAFCLDVSKLPIFLTTSFLLTLIETQLSLQDITPLRSFTGGVLLPIPLRW